MTYELRFTLRGLPGMTFVRRSAAETPAEQTAGFVDDGDAASWRRRPTPALFKNGEWAPLSGKRLTFTPTFWTVLEFPSDR